MSINAIKDDEQMSTVSKKITMLRLFRYLLTYRVTIVFVILIMLVTDRKSVV